jgi:hypothetical protein
MLDPRFWIKIGGKIENGKSENTEMRGMQSGKTAMYARRR